MIAVTKYNMKIEANPEKVIAKYLLFKIRKRIQRIVSDVLSLDEKTVEKTLGQVLDEFENRHLDKKY